MVITGTGDFIANTTLNECTPVCVALNKEFMSQSFTAGMITATAGILLIVAAFYLGRYIRGKRVQGD